MQECNGSIHTIWIADKYSQKEMWYSFVHKDISKTHMPWTLNMPITLGMYGYLLIEICLILRHLVEIYECC